MDAVGPHAFGAELGRIRKTEHLSELYMPQVEQFGVKLEQRGDALVGSVSNERADAAVCVYRIGDVGVVTSHRILVKRDMLFCEHALPGLSVASLSADSLALCPIDQPTRARPAGNVAIFGQDTRELTTPLRAGSIQNATSITLLPEWFNHWDSKGVRTAHIIMETVAEACPGDLATWLNTTLHGMSPLFGGKLLSSGAAAQCVDRIASNVATWHVERERAEQEAGTLVQTRLVRAARRAIALHLGDTLTLDGLAHDLFTSRTRLCAAFRQETGESIGSYIREARMRRARELLRCPLCSITEVADAVGYSRTSSFTVAFERAHGCSPTAWRNLVTPGGSEHQEHGAAKL